MNTHLALRQALEAVERLTDPEPPWLAVLESARRLVGADSATFTLLDHADALLMFQQTQGRPEAERDYLDHFHALDIMLPKARTAGAGEWLDTHVLFPASTLARDPYYVDFMCRHRVRQMLTLMVENSPSQHGGLSFQRATPTGDSRRQFESPAIRTFNHALQQALARRRRMAQHWIEAVESGFAAFDDALCVTTCSGGIVWLSPECEHLLRGSSALRVRNDHLWHPEASVRAALHLSLARASSTTHGVGHTPLRLTVPHPQGGTPCQLEFAPAHARVKLGDESTVLIRIQCHAVPRAVSAPALCGAFGITPAEARVLAALIAGQSATEHALARGVSVHTVRKQIATLMDKMDCTRQVDLVRIGLAAL